MGTRGILGFKYKAKKYITYVHNDSYPTYLGMIMQKAVSELLLGDNLEIARANVENISLLYHTSINDYHPQWQADIKKELVRFGMFDYKATDNETDMCKLLQDAREDPLFWLRDGLKYMMDADAFAHDSLFCEWGYLLDFDLLHVGVYRGFQNSEHFAGEWQSGIAKDGYYPIKEVKLYAFPDFAMLDMKKLEETITKEEE